VNFIYLNAYQGREREARFVRPVRVAVNLNTVVEIRPYRYCEPDSAAVIEATDILFVTGKRIAYDTSFDQVCAMLAQKEEKGLLVNLTSQTIWGLK
jgi:hypothetical protein